MLFRSCLGVLCDLAIKNGVEEQWNTDSEFSHRYTLKNYRDFNMPSMDVKNWAGMITFSINSSINILWTMNDNENKTFYEIADYIENNWENI